MNEFGPIYIIIVRQLGCIWFDREMGKKEKYGNQ
jgi:hypothetical protein